MKRGANKTKGEEERHDAEKEGQEEEEEEEANRNSIYVHHMLHDRAHTSLKCGTSFRV